MTCYPGRSLIIYQRLRKANTIIQQAGLFSHVLALSWRYHYAENIAIFHETSATLSNLARFSRWLKNLSRCGKSKSEHFLIKEDAVLTCYFLRVAMWACAFLKTKCLFMYSKKIYTFQICKLFFTKS